MAAPLWASATGEEIRISLKAGQSQAVRIELGTVTERATDWSVELIRGGSGEASEELRLWIENRPIQVPERWTDLDSPESRPQIAVLTARPGRRFIQLGVAVHPCAVESIQEARLSVRIADSGAGSLIEVPLRFEVVQPQGFGSCHRALLAGWSSGILLFLVLTAAWIAWEKSHFLQLDKVAAALHPLEHREHGDLRRRDGDRFAIRQKLRKLLSRLHRLEIWLRANPLTLLLPGRTYRETIRIDLPRRGIGISARLLVGRRIHQTPMALGAGSLLAEATESGSFQFLGLPDDEGQINNLVSQPPLEISDPPRLVLLPNGIRLLRLADESGSAGFLGGWQLSNRSTARGGR